MQRSPSLTQAISAAEAILRADTDDLKQLAAIVGQDPHIMYMGADLTGVDLTRQDVSFLVGLGTSFEGATLTDEQRRHLRSGVKEERKQKTRKSIRDVRVDLVLSFIERHVNDDMAQYHPPSAMSIPHDWDSDTQQAILRDKQQSLRRSFEATLRQTLLDPILNSSSSNPRDHFGSDYMSSALANLSNYLTGKSTKFFEELFELLGNIQCPVDREVTEVLNSKYRGELGPKLGTLVAKMRPTVELDIWWVFDQPGFSAMIDAAIEISWHREVHAAVIEGFATSSVELEIVLQMLTATRYHIEADRAERTAYAIVSRKWPASMTTSVLEADVPRSLSLAIFRQLLAQGESSRISKIVQWLDRSKGAVGALSLENAIDNIHDFTSVYKLAEMLAPNLKPNQLHVFNSRLSKLAYMDSDRSNLSKFRQKYL